MTEGWRSETSVDVRPGASLWPQLYWQTVGSQLFSLLELVRTELAGRLEH